MSARRQRLAAAGFRLYRPSFPRPPFATAANSARIRNPRHGVMPAWFVRLAEPVVKELAVYVYTLGGGQ